MNWTKPKRIERNLRGVQAAGPGDRSIAPDAGRGVQVFKTGKFGIQVYIQMFSDWLFTSIVLEDRRRRVRGVGQAERRSAHSTLVYSTLHTQTANYSVFVKSSLDVTMLVVRWISCSNPINHGVHYTNQGSKGQLDGTSLLSSDRSSAAGGCRGSRSARVHCVFQGSRVASVACQVSQDGKVHYRNS